MSKYRRIETGTWTDGDFMSWSDPAKFLWLYLLSGRRTLPIPGVVVAREAVIADDLKWSIPAFRKAFREVASRGRVSADWSSGVVVLRRALFESSGRPRETNMPQSPNVIRGWAKCWRDIPDCQIKSDLFEELAAFAEALGEAFAKAFAEAWPRPSPIQDQEKKKDQDQESDLSLALGDQPALRFDFDAVYEAYPRKQGRKDGIEKLRGKVKSESDYQALLEAAVRMGQAWGGRDTKFCPLFLTFVNQERWRDGELPMPRDEKPGRYQVVTGDEVYPDGEVEL